MRVHLDLIEYTPGAFIEAILRHVNTGCNALTFRPFNSFARVVAARVAKAAPNVHIEFEGQERAQPDEEGLTLKRGAANRAIVLCDDKADALSSHLMDYLDLEQGAVVAPISAHYSQARPLFLISVPKGGTHLLYEFAHTLGYGAIQGCPENPVPGYWHTLEGEHSHTRAPEFLDTTSWHAPVCNRDHPFVRSPAVFIYRNPLDVLISEANFYHKDGNMIYSGYLSPLSFEERVLRLIDDPWLLNSIRWRVGQFIAWLDMPNVIPVSFEEIVGPQGGGDLATQLRLIWSLQLKLHVSGSPEQFADKVFNPNSPTFHAGQIGSYRKHLSPAAREKFLTLPQDFMEAYGYDGPNVEAPVLIPRHAERFRKRALTVSKFNLSNQPILLEANYLGHNLVKFQGKVFGMRHTLGAVDLTQVTPAQMAQLVVDEDVSAVKSWILQAECRRILSDQLQSEAVAPTVQRRFDPPPSEGSDRMSTECAVANSTTASSPSQKHEAVEVDAPEFDPTSLAPKVTQYYYEYCRGGNRPYFGPVLRALQGRPVRHIYMQRLVQKECSSRAGKPLSILEIGSWAGGSAITWAEAIKRYNQGAGRVLCVDPWVCYFDPERCGGLPIYHDMAEALTNDAIFPLFLHNIRSSGHEDIVAPLRVSSEQACATLDEGAFDIVFLDGDHTYEGVTRDLKAASRLVREGGVLCGDDLELQLEQVGETEVVANLEIDFVLNDDINLRYHPGVTLALGRFFGSVSVYNGFWAMRRRGEGWEPVELPHALPNPFTPPDHLKGIGLADYLDAAEYYLEHNLPTKAANLFAWAFSLGEPELEVWEQPEALEQRAERIAASEWSASASAVLEQLAAHESKGTPAWLLLGLIRMQQGALIEGRTALANAAMKRPKDPYLLNKLGEAIYATGDVDRAVAAFNEAYRLDPRSSEINNNLAVVHAGKGDVRLAIQYARRAVHHAPQNSNTVVNYAKLLQVTGQPRQATDLLRRYLAAQEDATVRSELDQLCMANAS